MYSLSTFPSKAHAKLSDFPTNICVMVLLHSL